MEDVNEKVHKWIQNVQFVFLALCGLLPLRMKVFIKMFELRFGESP